MNDACLAPWQRQLAHVFNAQGFVECAEEGFVAYVVTWFVDHLYRPRCANSRPVRLRSAEFDEWRAQILEVWHDNIDHSAPVDITFVLPNPPHTETETILAHLLLEQHRPPVTHSAGVISVIRQGRRYAALRHIAVSTGRFITVADILRVVSLQDLCVFHRCRITLRPYGPSAWRH